MKVGKVWAGLFFVGTVHLFSGYGVYAQSAIRLTGPEKGEIGNNYDVTPIGYYQNARCQFVYTKAEINAAGVTGPITLKKLGFDVVKVPDQACPNFTVRLKHTTLNSVSTPDNTATGFTVVYSAATYKPTKVGVDTITFTTDFNWNGTDNILVDICFGTAANFSNWGVVKSYNIYHNGQFAYEPSFGLNQNSMCEQPMLYQGYYGKPECVMVFCCYTLDAGLGRLVSPVNPYHKDSVQKVITTLKNYGSATLTSTRINWSVNGVEMDPVSWTGSLAQGQESIPIELGSTKLDKVENFLKIWVSSPNNGTDAFKGNDSIVTIRYPGLNGVYTIGESGAVFPSFSKALTVLSSGGALGPVTFKVKEGIYTEQLLIKPLPGVSKSSPVVFESESGLATDVIISHPNIYWDTTYVVQFKGARHVTFRNLSIYNVENGYGLGVQLMEQADSNTIENCHIQMSLTSEYGNSCGILIGSAEMYSEDVDFQERAAFNTFRGNKIQGGRYGIKIVGTTDSLTAGNRILGNTIQAALVAGIKTYDLKNIFIEGNKITLRGNYQESYGIFLSGINDSLYVNANMVAKTHQVGIYLYNCYLNRSGLVSNNMLSRFRESSQGRGIQVSSVNKTAIVHNSVWYNESGTVGSSCLAVENCDSVRILNNILYNSTGNGHAMAVLSGSGVIQCDHNDYSSTGPFVYWDQDIADLAALRTKNGMDAKSISVAPAFISESDLHTNLPALDGKAMPLAAVEKDFDGQLRSKTAPDIGADEFSLGRDISLAALNGLPPSTEPGTPHTVRAVLRNVGAIQVKDVQVRLFVDGNLLSETVITQSILPDSTFTHTFSESVLFTQEGVHTVMAVVQVQGDVNTGNDTLSKTVDVVTGLAHQHDALTQLRIYPVPARNQISIELPYGISGPAKVEVFDALGKTCWNATIDADTQHIVQVDPVQWAPGGYWVRVGNGQGYYWGKALIQDR